MSLEQFAIMAIPDVPAPATITNINDLRGSLACQAQTIRRTDLPSAIADDDSGFSMWKEEKACRLVGRREDLHEGLRLAAGKKLKENFQHMNQQTPIPPLGDFKNRKTGLVAFGILTMLMGGLCALLVPLMLIGQAMSAKATGVQQNAMVILPAIVIYGVLAVVLVWLGIGSIMARRWARALLLIFSWSWLIIGVISIAAMAAMAPHFMETIRAARPPGQPELPPAANLIMLLIPAVTLSVIFLVLPGVWVFFYRSKHVKATCETCDPVERWTDRCPLPVLALSLVLAMGTPMMLMMPVAYHGVMPFFGMFLTGLPGTVAGLVLAAIWGYSAWALYRLDRRGWWLIFACITFFAISSVITYSRHDLTEVYRLMNYPEEQIVQIQKFGMFKRGVMPWLMLLCTVPWIGYLLYVRKFFRKDA